MARAKTGLSGTVDFKPGPPKTTRQGRGKHSLPKRGRKKYRGQGR